LNVMTYVQHLMKIGHTVIQLLVVDTHFDTDERTNVDLVNTITMQQTASRKMSCCVG